MSTFVATPLDAITVLGYVPIIAPVVPNCRAKVPLVLKLITPLATGIDILLDPKDSELTLDIPVAMCLTSITSVLIGISVKVIVVPLTEYAAVGC